MTNTIVKSYSTDFGGDWNQSLFHQEVAANCGAGKAIVPNLLGTTQNGDVITINFDDNLSGSELVTLDGYISAHVNIPTVQYTQIQTFLTRNVENTNSTFARMCAFPFSGTTNGQPLQKITALCYKDAAVTNYTVRVYDQTNGIVMVYRRIVSSFISHTILCYCKWFTANRR